MLGRKFAPNQAVSRRSEEVAGDELRPLKLFGLLGLSCEKKDYGEVANVRQPTAKALGLEVPPMVLARADEVIE